MTTQAKTPDQIEAMTQDERLAYAQSIRSLILASQPVTAELISSALYAANRHLAERAKSRPSSRGVPKPKADAPAAQSTNFLDLF